jgi:hypothetical protein
MVVSRQFLSRVLYGLAILYALPSLAYPYGADASMFEYVARGWLDGSWPYSGVVDHKPPPIYALHALILMLNGGEPWLIRVMELFAILLMGRWIARIQTVENDGNDWLSPGLATLLVSSLYYTGFDYWNSAQTEIWVSLFLVASWFVAASRRGSLRRRMLLSGALAGIAFLFKFPAALPSLGIAFLYGWPPRSKSDAEDPHSRRRQFRSFLRSLFLFASAAGGVSLAAFLPFVVNGRLADSWQVLVLFNQFYAPVVHDRLATPAFLFDTLGIHTGAMLLLVLCGGLRAYASRDEAALRSGKSIAILLVLAVCSVAMQSKMYPYHWAVVTPFLAAALLWGLGSCFRSHPIPLHAAALSIVLCAFFVSPQSWNTACSTPACMQARGVWRYAVGTDSRWEYLKRFDHHYGYRDAEHLGQTVARLAAPGDTLCVLRVFVPTVYSSAKIPCTSRFFTSLHVGVISARPESAGELAAWIDEERTALRGSPPTYVVTRRGQKRPIEILIGQSYEVIERSEELLLMVRSAGPRERKRARPE